MRVLLDVFKVAFETVEANEPGLHEMNVLKHHPVAGFGTVVKSLFGSCFLALAHRDVYETAVGDGDVKGGSYLLHLWSGVHTGEQHEEDRGKVS